MYVSNVRVYIHQLNINPLRWRHNEHGGVSNYQPCDCLLNDLFRCRSKKTLAFVREWTSDRWIPRTKGQWRGKCFHLMTSSCDHNGSEAGICRGNYKRNSYSFIQENAFANVVNKLSAILSRPQCVEANLIWQCVNESCRLTLITTLLVAYHPFKPSQRIRR